MTKKTVAILFGILALAGLLYLTRAKNIVEDVVIRTTVNNWLDRFASGDTDSSTLAFTARQVKYSYDLLAGFRGDREKLYLAEYAAFSDDGYSAEWRIKQIGLSMTTLENLKAYRHRLFARLRSQLRDPMELRRFYAHKKPIILGEIAKRPELRDRIKVFLLQNEKDMSQWRANTTDESYATAFAKRRASEGGIDLVDEYQRILVDICNSI